MSDIINTAQTITVPSVKVKRHGPAPKFRPIIYQPPKPKYHVSVIATFHEAREQAIRAKRRNSRWTPEAQADLEKRIADGACLVDLAEVYDMSPSAVGAACRRLGIDPPPMRKEQRGHTRWTPEVKAEIIRMMDEGRKPREIAPAVDRDIKGVEQIMYIERRRRKLYEQHQSDS